MKKLLIILSLSLIALIATPQVVILPGWDNEQIADSVNTNLKELIDYTDATLYSVFDTLSDSWQSYQLYGLQEPLDSIADVFGVTLSDQLVLGMKGARFRLALNTIFSELYTYMEANPILTQTYLSNRADEAILTRNNKYIILR